MWFRSLSGRPPGGGHGNPLQCSCLENPMDRRAWRATVLGTAKSRTQRKQHTMYACMGNDEITICHLLINVSIGVFVMNSTPTKSKLHFFPLFLFCGKFSSGHFTAVAVYAQKSMVLSHEYHKSNLHWLSNFCFIYLGHKIPS